MKQKIENVVKEIIENVKKNGNKALIDYSEKFDNIKLKEKDLILDVKIFEKDYKNLDKKIAKALEKAKKNIFNYHKKQFENISKSQAKFSFSGEDFSISEKNTSVRRVGVYIPGGKFPYPSSVLMTIIPAKCANVKEIVVATPYKNLNQIVKAALYISGADKVLCVGGAQGIAALAYGTKGLEKVDLIVGPGNAFVNEAKRQVFGQVGIDMLAGPSDVMIFGDETVDTNWIAADLLAQIEHDKNAKAILISRDKKVLDDCKAKISRDNLKQIEFVFKKTIKEIVNFIDDHAPEHLEILTKDVKICDEIVKKISNAGAIFAGENATVAFGDYFLGPSHTLPTNLAAKFSSGLSVQTFLKRASVMKVSNDFAQNNANYIETIANAEGLKFHAKSVSIRKKTK